MKRLLAIGLLLITSACTASSADDASSAQDSADTETKGSPPSNFVSVRPGLYRGGHPDAENLDYLKSLGVKRILDLEVGDFIEAFPWEISEEMDNASQRDLKEIRYPMSAFEPAVSDRFDKDMNEIIALLATATADDPIYVHCKHGQDRTGLVIGLERVFDEKWAPKDAHDEMVKIGFHTGFAGLEEYFENKTGWQDD
ncbi:MAG TPA: tyrosine-protein phosphatase [Labilithrix sp.]|jgi:protein tyrosine/serine phosphatase